MNFAASPVLALTLPTWRSRLLLYVFIACFAVLLEMMDRAPEIPET